MKITRDAAKQLRTRADTLLKLAKALDHLDRFADANSARASRKLSRAARHKISVAQKKRWAKTRAK